MIRNLDFELSHKRVLVYGLYILHSLAYGFRIARYAHTLGAVLARNLRTMYEMRRHMVPSQPNGSHAPIRL